MDKYKEALEKVLENLRGIDFPVVEGDLIDEYINDSIDIITEALKEE